MSPHLLRPYSPRQLGLVEGGDQLMVFVSLAPLTAGPSLLVHVPTLGRRLMELPPSVEMVAFIDGPVPDPSVLAHLDDLVVVFEQTDTDCLVDHVPVTEAIKEVRNGRVVRGIPRGPLVYLRAPEVIRRPAVEAAFEQPPRLVWADPAGLVANAGGRVTLYPLELRRS